MLHARFFLLILLILTGCKNSVFAPSYPTADFELDCLKWASTVSICEDYIETDPVTGYLKIWNYQDDPYYGDALYVCGADLILNTGNVIEDMVAQSETKGELVCVSTEDDSVEWSSEDGSIFVLWQNLELEIDIWDCSYDQNHCATKGFGYITLE